MMSTRHVYRVNKKTGERSKVGKACDIPDALLLISWDQFDYPPSEWTWTMSQGAERSVFDSVGVN